MDVIDTIGRIVAILVIIFLPVLLIRMHRQFKRERKRHRAEWAKDLIRHNIYWENLRKRYGIK